MTVDKVRPAAALLLAALAVFAATLTGGCKRPEGVMSYDDVKKNQEDAMVTLKQRGAKFTEEIRPQGKSWAIDLSGQQISDDTFDLLKKVGYITALNLSKTNVTDAHMARVNEMGIGNLLLKLDLSNTAVTDAGLEKLDSLYLLSSLDLSGTKVTAAGVARFRSNRAGNSKINPMFKSPSIRL